MTALLYILLAALIGVGGAMQSSALGAISRSRGPAEAVWISLLAGLGAIGLVLAWRALRTDEAVLPPPLDRAPLFVAAAVIALVLLALSVRGLPAFYAGVGLFGLAYLAGSAFLVPKIGVGAFVGGLTAGTLITAVILDHVGALGATVQPLSVSRVAGVAALLAGLVLIRAGTVSD